MWYLSVPVEQRIKLGNQVLERLADTRATRQEGLTPDEVRGYRARVHLRLAQAAATNNDKGGVFTHVEGCLRLRVADITPAVINDDGTFANWRDTPEFKALLAKYQPPPGK
jgi:hypothetical protein